MPAPLTVAMFVVANRKPIGRAIAAAGTGLLVVSGVALSVANGAQDQQQTQNTAASTCGSPLPVLGTPPLGSDLQSLIADPARRQIAATIVSVGLSMKVPPRGWTIAIAVGLQESHLTNLSGGDRDSQGVFQQRPSAGWKNVRDVPYATGAFYQRLLAVPDWQQMPLTEAAQRVQRSAFPDAYAKWEQVSTQIVEQVTSSSTSSSIGSAAVVDPANLGQQDAQPCPDTGGTGAAAAGSVVGSGQGAQAARAAATQLGVTYVYGGGGAAGRSPAGGAGPSGFDCSGLVQFAWWQAARVQVPRTSAEQFDATQRVPVDQVRAGDLLFFNTEGSGVSHVGIADGHGGMIHAPHTGTVVQVVADVLSNSYWHGHFLGAGRVVGS